MAKTEIQGSVATIASAYRGTPEKLREQVRALETLEGYPLRPTFVGAGCAALVALDPNLGMTTKLTEVSDEGTVEIPAELVRKHAGKTVRVGGKDVTIDMGEPVP